MFSNKSQAEVANIIGLDGVIIVPSVSRKLFTIRRNIVEFYPYVFSLIFLGCTCEDINRDIYIHGRLVFFSYSF